MDKEQAIELVERFSQAIRSTYEPEMVVLYGSYAQGTGRGSSDIDVAVIVDRIDGDFLEAEAGLYRIRRQIDDRIEPILIEAGQDNSGFLDTVLRTGEIVYDRAPA